MGIRSFLKYRKTMSIEKKAMELEEVGETLLEELTEARENAEYARRKYEYLSDMYDYSEERKEALEDKLKEYKEKRIEMRGFPFPLLFKRLRDAFWRTGITKKGREFNKIERKMRTAERTLSRMQKNGTRRWEEILSAEQEIEEAEEKIESIEKAIIEKHKEKKDEIRTKSKESNHDIYKNRQNEEREEEKDEIKKEQARQEANKQEEKEETRNEEQQENTWQDDQTEQEDKEKETENESTEEKDTKQSKKNKFKDDLDMSIFTNNGIDVNSFEDALRNVNIDLKPKECLLFMGILQSEYNKNTYANVEDAIDASKKLANEVYKRIKTADLGEWEMSEEYFMQSGLHVFEKASQNTKNLSSAELFAANIARSYETVREEKEGQNDNEFRKDKDERMA